MTQVGTVGALRRYPVKSMLGEDLPTATLTASGVDGDRVAAVIDQRTGNVASAKQPRLWRGLLALSATWRDGSARVTFPDSTSYPVGEDGTDRALSAYLRREVRLSTRRPDSAQLARPAPEDVIEAGETADVPYEMLALGGGTPGTTFVDYAPVHLVTSATLDHVGAEMIRYRPNVVLDTPDCTPFAENDWTGREIVVGPVRLRVIQPTPRCALPTLAHGSLPPRVDAVRALLRHNRIPVPGVGPRPCLGTYAQVVAGGTIAVGDAARFD